jgi:hypothetical protein
MKNKKLIGKYMRNVIFSAAAICVQLLIFSFNAEAQQNAEKRFWGNWTTGLQKDNCLIIEGNMITVSLAIQDLDGGLFIRMGSPDADAFNLFADDAVVDDEKIKITFEKLNAIYKGKINESNNQIKGTISFPGKSFSLSFMRIVPAN